MNLTWICAILSVLIFANGLPEDELEQFISLTKYGYEESCKLSAESEWTFIKHPTNKTRLSWEKAEGEYALHKIKQVNETGDQRVESFNNSALEYAYNVVIKPGDALLETDDFSRLVSFSAQAEQMRLTGYYTTGMKKHFRQDAERQLARNKNAKEKLSTWSAWHQTLLPLSRNFSSHLKLVEKAAILNGENDIRGYWEMLSGYKNGYEHAKNEWYKIAPVHKKISQFVKNRLHLKYSDNINNSTLPAQLLGSLRGYDWTNLAMDTIPYPDITYEINKNLWEKEIIGESLYKEASKLGSKIFKHAPEADFWNESHFRGQCPSHLINLCKDGKMRISTCSEASIGNFISAHKNVAKILVTEMSHESVPILNVENRYSALEEGVAEFFGILSVSQAWLSSRGLIENNTNYDDIRIVSLMLTALDVLPRLAYYLAADEWRIRAMETGTFDGTGLETSWWKYRTEFERVSSDVPNLPTFLDDDHITSNKPYLSKFLGTILGFQIYEYLMESTEVRYDTITLPSGSHRLPSMLRDGFANDWVKVVQKYLDIDAVDADPMLSYFSALVDYIDEEEDVDEKVPIPEQQEKKLDQLADQYRKKFNTPTTTTTTTTPKPSTTTKATNPVASLPAKDPVVRNSQKIEPPKYSLSENATKNSTSTKNLEIPPANKTKQVPIETESVESEGSEISGQVPKPATSKAVWAVAAVLVATVTICIIAIFGRRRCRKAPKNRRYV